VQGANPQAPVKPEGGDSRAGERIANRQSQIVNRELQIVNQKVSEEKEP
jgi:hypothetical protein